MKGEPQGRSTARPAPGPIVGREGLYRYSILLNGEEVFDPELEMMN